MAVTTLVVLVVQGWHWRALLGAVIAGAFYAFLAALPGQGMGMGDVKFAAVLGALLMHLSIDAFILWLVAPFVAGAIVSVFLMITAKANARTRIPFGPYMVLGALVAIAATW